ncbi:hypothetical protein LIER_41024 [Lithospermum erythrorhizon]|uniref:Uncharacterized protein n=1 Tax=Lithospermum erythrorhizon TaxID=34254 RepID=A0AAV3R689_LITER
MRFKYESSDDSSEDNFEEVQNKFDVLDLCPMELCQRKVADATPPSPNAKVNVLPKKHDKPIPVIAYFDTGAGCTILKAKILPAAYWKNCSMEFREANGQCFTDSLISKPIYLQLFPVYTIKARVYGSDLSKKYLDIQKASYTNNTSSHRFPKNAYLMLWYLAQIYTFKLHVSADTLLRYLARCLLTDQDKEFTVFYKWLTLFHDAS